jgi:pyrroloquinoline quinone biosynthesis protein B
MIERLMTIEAVLLGIAQDGGVPQAGCYCATCTQARLDPSRRQWVVCLGLIDHTARQSWLIDATPDFKEQLDALHQLAPTYPLAGILLTHIHMGHYTGLIHLGPEAMNKQNLPLYATAQAADFLTNHAPWSYLVRRAHLQLNILEPNIQLALSPALKVEPVPVPHRAEFSDTLAFTLSGPRRRLFFCPDIDRWEAWDHDLREFLTGIEVALLDGCFFSPAELPGRDLSQIPHPMVSDTVARLAGLRCEVHLIHLNHTNPLLNDSPERAWLAQQGCQVGAFGRRWPL